MGPRFRFDVQADPAAGSVVKSWTIADCPPRGNCEERPPTCGSVQRCLVEIKDDPIRITVVFDKKKTSAGSPGPKAGCLATWDENGSAKLKLATKPRRCDFHIADGKSPIKRRSVVATAGVRWSKWGKNSAIGKGKIHMSGIGLQGAKFWLSRPREVCGNTVYTRLQYRLDQAGGRSSKVKIDGCVMPGSVPQTSRVTVRKAGLGRVTSNPAGIDCGRVCAADFPSYSMVSLTAIGTDPFEFAGWGRVGNCSAAPICRFPLRELDVVAPVKFERPTP